MIYTKTTSVEALQFDGTEDSAHDILAFVQADRDAKFANGSPLARRDFSHKKVFNPLLRVIKKYREREENHHANQHTLKKNGLMFVNDLQIVSATGTFSFVKGDYIVHDGDTVSVMRESEFKKEFRL